MWDSQITIEAVDESEAIERHGVQRQRSLRNWNWLQAHWNDLVPQAHGMFLAVADQEAFLAKTLDEALAWAKSAHPEDTGHIVEYVLPPQGPRSYQNRLC